MTEEKGFERKQGCFLWSPGIPRWPLLSLAFLWKDNLELACWEGRAAFRMGLLCSREWGNVGTAALVASW